MVNFTVICTEGHLDGRPRTGYGIEIVRDKAVIGRFEDITFSKEKINYFADVCNRCQVSPVHFNDVLENFLSDFETF